MATKVVTPNYKKVKRIKKVDVDTSPIPKFSYKSAFYHCHKCCVLLLFPPKHACNFWSRYKNHNNDRKCCYYKFCRLLLSLFYRNG